MKNTLLTIALCSLALPAFAQSHWTGYVGGGFAEPVKDLGTRLNVGWNAAAGVGLSGQHLGIMLDASFNHFGINDTSLNRVGVAGGSTRVWGFTLDPIVHLAPKDGPMDVYVTGGGGVYYRTVQFTQPGITTVTAFDPWFGVFYPANVASNIVVGSYSVAKPGVDFGAGMSFRLGASHAKLFAEARYHHMFTNNIDTTYVPVTFGIRW